MSVLFNEQDAFVIEMSLENIVPIPAYDGMAIHHEKNDIESIREFIESVGGEVHHE